jgi:hypothetical protein
MAPTKLLISIGSLWLLCGYANVAQFPKVLRQTYEDGTFTEVECQKHTELGRQNCVFRIGSGDHAGSYEFVLLDYGYSSWFVMESYYYWPNGGMFPPNVLFEVPCIDADLNQIPKATSDNTRCNLTLAADGARLVAQSVSINAIIDGNLFNANRTFTR